MLIRAKTGMPLEIVHLRRYVTWVARRRGWELQPRHQHAVHTSRVKGRLSDRALGAEAGARGEQGAHGGTVSVLVELAAAAVARAAESRHAGAGALRKSDSQAGLVMYASFAHQQHPDGLADLLATS